MKLLEHERQEGVGARPEPSKALTEDARNAIEALHDAAWREGWAEAKTPSDGERREWAKASNDARAKLTTLLSGQPGALEGNSLEYDYVRRTYGVTPVPGRGVWSTSGVHGVIEHEDQTQRHYVQVLFSGCSRAIPCHPTALRYE